MSVTGTEDLTQTKSQDGDWSANQFENQDACEATKPWGRITPRRTIIRQIGYQSIHENMSVRK